MFYLISIRPEPPTNVQNYVTTNRNVKPWLFTLKKGQKIIVGWKQMSKQEKFAPEVVSPYRVTNVLSSQVHY